MDIALTNAILPTMQANICWDLLFLTAKVAGKILYLRVHDFIFTTLLQVEMHIQLSIAAVIALAKALGSLTTNRCQRVTTLHPPHPSMFYVQQIQLYQ